MDENHVQKLFEVFYERFVNVDAKIAYANELQTLLKSIKDALNVAFVMGYEAGIGNETE